MHPRRRYLRVAKWIGTLLSASILTAYALSVPTLGTNMLSAYWLNDSFGFSYGLGEVHLYRNLPTPDDTQDAFWMLHKGLHLGWIETPDEPRWLDYGIRTPARTSLNSFRVPLWLPFVLAAVPTCLLWWRDRRIKLPGHCRSCNYNLTGNTSGICPECGTAIENPAPSP